MRGSSCFAAQLLGAHELRRAEHDAGGGELLDARVGAAFLREAEVHHHRALRPPSARATIMMFSGFRSRWMISSSCATLQSGAHVLHELARRLQSTDAAIRTLRSDSSSPLHERHHDVDESRRPSRPSRMMWHTFGCASRMPSAASRRRRAIAFGSWTSAGDRILIATSRPVVRVLREIHEATSRPRRPSSPPGSGRRAAGR